MAGEVTADNWVRHFQAAIRANGGSFVIRNASPKDHGQTTPAEWYAWMAYFYQHGIPTRFMEAHSVVTVPCQWPEDFDATCEPSDKFARFPAKPEIDKHMRVRVAALFRRLAGSMHVEPDKWLPKPPQTKQQAQDIVAAGFPHLQGPVTAGPALRAQFRNDDP